MQLLRGRTIGVDRLAVSPDGRYVVAGGQGECHAWDMHESEEEAGTPLAASGGGRTLQFTSATELFTGISDSSERYDFESGGQTAFDVSAEFFLSGAILHPSGKLLKGTRPTGRADHSRCVETYSYSEGRFQRDPTHEVDIAHADLLAFNPSGDHYLARRDREISLVETATDLVAARFELPKNESSEVGCQLFRYDGKQLYLGVKRNLFVFDCDGGLPLAATRSRRLIRALSLHPDGRLLATVEDGRAVAFRDADTLEVVRSYDFAMPTVTCVAFTPDGTRCVIGNSRGKVLLFDVD